jgi:hypothetical protein
MKMNLRSLRASAGVAAVAMLVGCADGSSTTEDDATQQRVLRDEKVGDYVVNAEDRYDGHTVVVFSDRDHAVAKFDWQREVGTIEDYEWVYKASLGPRPEGSLHDVASAAHLLLQSFRDEHP